MGLVAESKYLNLGSTPQVEVNSRKREGRASVDDDDEDDELSRDETAEIEIAKYCQKLLKAGVAARADHDTYDLAWELYIGDMWPRGLARWKAKITINKIRALIHFMQAVMTDNKPRFSVMPRVPGTSESAHLLDKLCDRDWDESDTQDKISLAVLWGLIWGTGIMKCYYDPRGNGGRGQHITSPVVPYRIYTDRLATCVEDARFIIHIEPRALGWIYENYPHKAMAVKRIRGARAAAANASGEQQRDFIRENQNSRGADAGQNNEQIVGKGIITPIAVTNDRSSVVDKSRDDDQEQIEVAEYWFRDEATEKYAKHKRENGKLVYEDVEDEHGIPELILDGIYETTNPLDGTPLSMPKYKAKQRPTMIEATRAKYPNGRLVIMAGPVLMVDIPNPFQTDGFPFAIWKNQDVGTFHGQGEPLALKDMNIAINRIVGQIYDNLNLTGNPSFLVSKQAGINMRTLRARPALIIPTDDMNGMKPLDVKPMPPQYMELLGLLKQSIGEVAGVSDAITNGAVPSNTAFATVDQLQESSSATLRQKVRNMERMIKRMGKLRISLIQQFDNGERPLRSLDDGNGSALTPWEPIYEDGDPEGTVLAVVPPAKDVQVRFQNYVNADLQGQVEFQVVPDSSLSTSPSGMWNRYMQLWEKKLIDLQSFHEKFKMEDYRLIVQRMQAMSALGAAKKKPGPAPKVGRVGSPRPPAPGNSMPSRADLNATR